MSEPRAYRIRTATPDDAPRIAELLHAFNTEFDTATPGVEVLTRRLRSLLGGTATFAIVGGEPAVGVALVTVRPNVWSDAPVALLDEMYVDPAERGGGLGSEIMRVMIEACQRLGVGEIEINGDASDADAMRFYEAHGFTGSDPATGERALYYSRSI
ncbi:GNAT family N-acetyltransferase [Microbacterium sp. 1.5R]|uniref:GNAT family N-acetyltransferase n=1 Tax=Microbacterium sp. 1.5R TaxID=1916917 RepID=UPI0011A81763|nr:GNAT family N-acetyltransferase [Microbacterium sp. 1.5R]